MSSLKTALAQRWHCRCAYCSNTVRLTADPNDPNALSIDHFIPRAAGGRRTQRNSVFACRACNRAKGSMNPHQIMKVWIQVDTEGFGRAVLDTIHWFHAQPLALEHDDPPNSET